MTKKEKLPIITFGEGAKDWLLDVFDKATDGEGYIVEKFNPGQRVLTPTSGEEITKKELAVIKSGSERFIKGDITSLMEVANNEV